MSYSDIVAVTSGRSSDEVVVGAAARLAEKFRAVARIVPAFPDVAAEFIALGAELSTPTEEVMESLAEAEHENMAALTHIAKAAAESAAIAFGPGDDGPRLTVLSRGVLPWLTAIQAVPVTDLLVFDADSARGKGPVGVVFHDVLFGERAPVFVARNLPANFNRVCVAWDGGAQAGRAVRAAMPFLLAAEEVVILQASKGLSEAQRGNPNSTPERLQSYLRHKGVQHSDVMLVEDQAEGPGLAAAIRTVEGRLLVAGAWGHSRLREIVLGGATRSFVEMADGPPLLLSR